MIRYDPSLSGLPRSSGLPGLNNFTLIALIEAPASMQLALPRRFKAAAAWCIHLDSPRSAPRFLTTRRLRQRHVDFTLITLITLIRYDSAPSIPLRPAGRIPKCAHEDVEFLESGFTLFLSPDCGTAIRLPHSALFTLIHFDSVGFTLMALGAVLSPSSSHRTHSPDMKTAHDRMSLLPDRHSSFWFRHSSSHRPFQNQFCKIPPIRS
jgi:hypothetical protein